MFGYIGSDESSSSEHVDPKSDYDSQSIRRRIGKLDGKYRLEAIQPCKHGKQERIDVTGHKFPIDGANHGNLWINWLDLAGYGVAEEGKEIEGLFDIAGGGNGS